ncbi:MAG: indolepyruvate ferredoxin oxidoreductase family protein, partial [Paracoccaceae bacterium]|nr:indolepyruvate ferredoxin oxidoreductase family protein [Paracoccaceae bacterium]
TTGKAHLDLMEALRLLGVDEATCRRLGIDIYKVGMVWPLARRAALDFVRGKQEVLVIEEKRGIIESQLKEYFYDWPGDKPARMVGKRDENGRRLVPWTGELSPRLLAPIVAARLDLLFPGEGFAARARSLTDTPVPALNLPAGQRTPYYCSGCPHNTSTRVPEGSRAQAGIGCHVMASWMNRNTDSLTQMGGEGVNWVGACKFTDEEHVFQNLGEGTWYHSGSMAVRQAVAAGANITFKILYNDAVAMTGGQPVDGPVSVQSIAQTSRAEGVQRIALVSDQPEIFRSADFPSGTTFHHRRELDALQRELRRLKGVSVLIYVQTCATEKRRRRKRGLMADIKRHVIINEAVCEGCGDCSIASNCLSVEPVETPLGRKRRINQSSCNKDFTCLDGFCPAMVTVEGERRKASAELPDLATLLKGIKAPELPALDHPFDLLVTGVGGTGVVTVGALITMAAHLEGKGSSVLDFTGFAQKFGPVLSYVRLAERPEIINQLRIDQGAADAMIGCDSVVSTMPKATGLLRRGTRSVLNTAEMPTGEIVLNRDASLHVPARQRALESLVGAENLWAIDANALAERYLGDAVFANVIMLGMAWQKGLVPVSEAALRRAIELNGVAIERNQAALALGRVLAAAPERLKVAPETPARPGHFDAVLDQLATYLQQGYGPAAAARFKSRATGFRAATLDDMLATIHARSLFHLLAIKDEFEVARLLTDPAFEQRLAQEFEPGFKVNYHLAPEFLPTGRRDGRGRPLKRRFGPWLRPGLALVARLRGLRGTAFDPFRWQADRRLERVTLDWFEKLADQCIKQGEGRDTALWAEILAAPLEIRGFGPVRAEATVRTRAEVEKLLAGAT